MGKYINNIEGTSLGASFISKCAVLQDKGAVKVTGEKFLPNMVCVVNNGHFAAAGWAYDEREYKDFLPTKSDNRPRQWYTLEGVEKYATD